METPPRTVSTANLIPPPTFTPANGDELGIDPDPEDARPKDEETHAPGEDEGRDGAAADAREGGEGNDVEARGKRLFAALTRQGKDTYLRDEESGGFYLITEEGRRVPINDRSDNVEMMRLTFARCGLSLKDRGVQVAIQRLQVHASESTDRVRMRKFSAMSDDLLRLYVPTLTSGKVLCIHAHMNPQLVANGRQPGNGKKAKGDGIWVEHPLETGISLVIHSGSRGSLLTGSLDPALGLGGFERLLVETQGCRVPEMKWFVAMHEGLFPYVRDVAEARLIAVHHGSSQNGKTSGAQRFLKLHGLGEVCGDVTVAAVANHGDTGLIVLDNVEHQNLTPKLIDHLLFSATGGARMRSDTSGRNRINERRPVVVLTSIEGVFKKELINRSVAVEYELNKTGDARLLRRSEIEREIVERRDAIRLSLMAVLRRFLEVRGRKLPYPNPRPEFEEHFTALCDLLTAYEEVASKPAGWAQSLIDKWDEVLRGERDDEPEDELEWVILKALKMGDDEMLWKTPTEKSPWGSHKGINVEGKRGVLYVFKATDLYQMACKVAQMPGGRNVQLPKASNAFVKRLNGMKPRGFVYLNSERDARVGDLLPMLRRTATAKPFGIFVEDDG